MSLLPFPADSAEYEEYCTVMDAMANEAEASTPDPEPSDYTPEDQENDDLRARESDDYWASMYEREEPEDRYLDTYWEDQSEYGMEGCCGDF